jgi:hypothetical protein
MMKCQHKGCEHEGQECRLPDDAEPTEWYCADHAQEAGYCYMCGGFFAGIENFEFGKGLCEECDAQAKADSEDWDDDAYF